MSVADFGLAVPTAARATRGRRTRRLPAADAAVPLVVDLDGTLIASDLLIERFAHLAARNPRRALSALVALRFGKAALKDAVAAGDALDPASLPYDETVLSLIRKARAAGRPVHLVSASPAPWVEAVARHLGLFDGIAATANGVNLGGTAKADLLLERFGEGGFDYVGDSRADLAVWRRARRAISVGAPALVRRALDAGDVPAEHFDAAGGRLSDWLKLMRVHQWAKNGLLFVSLLTSHLFGLAEFAAAFLAAIAFSLTASGVYVLNDLVDLEADRAHPTKRARPLAAGRVPILKALALAPALVVTGIAIGLAVGLPFLGVLALYLAATTAYSFVLKRKMLVDVVTLAGLYTLRVIAGGVAIGAMPSPWLLAFSMLIFTALAVVKRYTELAMRRDEGLPDPSNRNYKIADLPVLGALAAGAGVNAITVLALYVSSPTAKALYARPELLWLLCPVMLYWISRILLMAHRRLIDDDPIVFALKDRVSQLAILCLTAITLAAI